MEVENFDIMQLSIQGGLENRHKVCVRQKRGQEEGKYVGKGVDEGKGAGSGHM